VGRVKTLDWVVLISTIAFIVIYGTVRTRKSARDMTSYFHEQTLRWPTIGLSIMATQASAITFLSMPGQGFEDGMRFVQFYFGMPLAMIVISAYFVPIYHRLGVRTAYEYLEHRFDVNVRYFGAISFLIQRGLATGVTIYAPAIILSSILGWSLTATNIGIGTIVTAYTVLGGTQAVSQTQKQQMVVMMLGLFLALAIVLLRLPDGISLSHAVKLTGALSRMNPVSFELSFEKRYNFWSGMTGGFFLALSYFGTDQSQVQRYLSGRSVTESRLGLLFNGMFKIPMQFVILFIGLMVFVFHLFVAPPLYFNEAALGRVAHTEEHARELEGLQAEHAQAFEARRTAALAYVAALDKPDASADAERAETKAQLQAAQKHNDSVHAKTQDLIRRALPGAEANDTDYVFLGFVLRYVPTGLIGLLIAVILCAAMGSTASELSALGSTTTLDLYQRMRRTPPSAEHGLFVSKLFTAAWGVVAIGFASFATLVDNLIEAVNILGSLFYGTILGIFLVGLGLPFIRARAVLIAACISQTLVLALYFVTKLGFLWFNVVGSMAVVALAALWQFGQNLRTRAAH
jgi:Na+/proline symporter